MMEAIFAAAYAANQSSIEHENAWYAEFQKADPITKRIMLEVREKIRKEEIEERRHRENIRAQEKIADAIRSTRIWP